MNSCQDKRKRGLSLQEADVVCALALEPYVSQRRLSDVTGHSLGAVNQSIHALVRAGYLTKFVQLTDKARTALASHAPRNAVILAAGPGMRMIPINQTTPKAFLEVRGEPLIERLIRQLHDADIRDITIVVGFMKDQFEYLMDAYGVELVVNEEYALKNNVYSLARVLDRLGNTYVIPCDIWCRRNPFRRRELYSWYMVSDRIDRDSAVRVNRRRELTDVGKAGGGSRMIGISYLLWPEAEKVVMNVRRLIADSGHDDSFWEEALHEKDRMFVAARTVDDTEIVEINSYEQLRDLDSNSNQLENSAIRTIAETLDVSPQNIEQISVLKKGMTNRSFLFSVGGKKYIMRIPGEGTEQLINRGNEAAVFQAIRGAGLCDDPVYINPMNGYKITSFLDSVRVCDAGSADDIGRCMKKLRHFHEMKLTVPHTFDLFGQIDFYESLWEGDPSIYRDYRKTKENAVSLKTFIDGQPKDWCLTHIDAVPDNFLFYMKDGAEELQLTDWEYAGMQDPHVDIAMFCIYSLYDRDAVDRLIDIYFDGRCDAATRIKIYCYIAVCGLLWSNWCEYKRRLGVEFGDYSLRQYRYAKDYFRYASEGIERLQLV